MSGKVYLVGAGPGDGGLMTIKGRDLLHGADVVVYDRLVGREVMEMIPAGAQRIDVGKNAGRHPVPQNEINEILAACAKAGKTVVRLKGGDPFVFGRGGEELEYLADQGIEFEEVPGITSSIAAAAYAGIPVTHRDFCSSLHIITGHARAGKELDLDFEALARMGGTLVFLMSVATIGRIAEGLLEAGMDPDMPCAVIENGTMPRQRKIVSVLSEIAGEVRKQKVHSPAAILVGRVCTLSDRFDWVSKRPLQGQRILVTQPQARSSRLAEGLRRLGAEAMLYPCIETAPIRPLSIPEGMGDDPFDTLVFTSAEGVRSYCSWLLEEGRDVRTLAGKRIACIGSATAAALKGYGLQADFVPSVYNGRVLGEEMVSGGFVDENSRVLLLRTAAASRDVTDVLAEAGIPYEDVPVYETTILKQEPLEDMGQFDLVSFTSRSCVTGFVQSQGRTDFTGVKALCIGEKTAEEAAKYGFECIISGTATIESMLDKAAHPDPEEGKGLPGCEEEEGKKRPRQTEAEAPESLCDRHPHIVRGSPSDEA